MSESQSSARLQVRLNLFLVNLSLVLVRQQNHDHVGFGDGLADRLDFQTLLLGVIHGLGGRTQTNDDVHTGIAQVQCMSVTLRTVTKDGHLLAFKHRQIGVLFVPDSCCHDWRSFYFFIASGSYFSRKNFRFLLLVRLLQRLVIPRMLLPPDCVREITPPLLRNCSSPVFFILVADVHIVVMFCVKRFL